MTAPEENSDGKSKASSLWPTLGLGGILSLCCLFAAPAASGAVGGTAAAGATAALNGGIIQVSVTALTVGTLIAVFRLRSKSKSCETEWGNFTRDEW